MVTNRLFDLYVYISWHQLTIPKVVRLSSTQIGNTVATEVDFNPKSGSIKFGGNPYWLTSGDGFQSQKWFD